MAEVNRLITNDLSALPEHKALYTCCCSEDGGILDDLIVYKFSSSRILVVCNASNIEKIRSHFQTELSCSLTDKSQETALIAIQGPRAVELLALLSETAIQLARFQITEGELLGTRCYVARTGYTGEDGFELFCPRHAARTLWDQLLEKGADLGAKPVGLAARDTLRLEAGLPLYGNDITEQTTPLEAGLSWVVKFDKQQFIGKDALREQQRRGVSRRLVGFEMTGRGIARAGYQLLSQEGRGVGLCTSGAPAPSLGKSVGLGYLPVPLAEPGTTFLVDCRGRPISAQVVKTPFYRRPKPKAQART